MLAWLLVGLFALLFVPFIIDVWRTHNRKKELLKAMTPTIGKLSESELDDLGKQTTTGIEGLARTLMAFGVIGVFAVALLYVVLKNVNVAADSVVGNAMAALITLLTAVVAFYFGTRSAQTSAAAAAAVSQKTPPPPPPPPETTTRAEQATETTAQKQARLKKLAEENPVQLPGETPAPPQEQETTQEQEK